MGLDVIKQGREDGQQCHSDVVDALADALHLGTRLHEFAQLEHLHQLLQVFGCVLKEGPEAGFDQLRAGLHDCSERAERTRELRMAAGRHFCLMDHRAHAKQKAWAYLVSSECVRMCRQLTIIAESLPERKKTNKHSLFEEEGGLGSNGLHVTALCI